MIEVRPKQATKIFAPEDFYGAGVFIELRPRQTWIAKTNTRFVYLNNGGLKLRLTHNQFNNLFEEVHHD